MADLEPVEYRLEVSAQGFKKEVIDNIKVDTASIATVNIKMEPGSVDYEDHRAGIRGNDRHLVGNAQQHCDPASD